MRAEMKTLEHDNYSLERQLEEALASGKRLVEENEALKVQGLASYLVGYSKLILLKAAN